MQDKTRQHLENQLRCLKQQREATKRKLRTLARQAQRDRRYRCGTLVELAGLAEVDPDILLGGLCELAEMIHDESTASRWKVVGETKLAAQRQRQSHRQPLVTSTMEEGALPTDSNSAPR